MVTQWGAKWNWSQFGCGRRSEERWEGKTGGAAEVDGSREEGQVANGGPEIEGIAVGSAGEAVVDLTGEMNREGSA